MDENNLKVLIADDDADTVGALKWRFERAEFEVFQAYNGLEAVQTFQKQLELGNLISLCVLDYGMPLMKGSVAATEIIELCKEKGVLCPEIIIFTGSTDANLMLRLQTAEIGVALIKPQGLKQLERIINRFSKQPEYIFSESPGAKSLKSVH